MGRRPAGLVLALVAVALTGCVEGGLGEPADTKTPSTWYCPLRSDGIHGFGSDGTSSSGYYGFVEGLEVRAVLTADATYHVSFCNRVGRTLWASEATDTCRQGFVNAYVKVDDRDVRWPRHACDDPFGVAVADGSGWGQSIDLRELDWREAGLPEGPADLHLYVSLPFSEHGYVDGTWASAAVTLEWAGLPR